MSLPPFSSAPGITESTADGRYADLRALGFGFISSDPQKPGSTSSVDTSDTVLWTRKECVAAYAVSEVIAAYGHMLPTTGDGEAQAFNSVLVGSTVRKQGAAITRGPLDPYYPQSFNGVKYATVPPDGTIVLTDATTVGVAYGERFFTENSVSPILPPGPGTPALTASTGGSLTVGTWYVAYTYLLLNGVESAMSAVQSITLTGGQTSIIATAPTSVSGAIWYRVYITSSVNLTATSDLYAFPNYAWNKLGSDTTIGNVTVTGTGRPSNGGTTNGLYPQVKANQQGIATSGGVNGAANTQVGGLVNGESFLSGADHLYDAATVSGRSSQTAAYCPWFVLGKASDGKRHVSIAVFGDSISFGTGDPAYRSGSGGFIRRAMNGQQNNLIYNVNSLTPIFGFVNNAQGGETEQALANLNCSGHRFQTLKWATHAIDGEGVNDYYAAGQGTLNFYTYAQTVYGIVAGQSVYYVHLTLTPRAVTTDGYLTQGNQSITSGLTEGQRRAGNNVIKDSTGAVTFGPETPYRVNTTVLPATNSYSGGDGTATQFVAAYPFLVGSEMVTVAGATVSYTYINQTTVNGQSYAEGVTFSVAPANGATVRFIYTKIPGMGTWGTWWGGYVDTGSAFETNGTGTLTPNGGFVLAPGSAVVQSSPTTAGSTTTLTDTSLAGTLNQYAGYMLRIVSDTGNPSAAGQITPVYWSTASGGGVALTFSALAQAPTTSAVYQLYLGNMSGDTIHPASHGHLLMAQVLAAAAPQFRVNGLV